MTESKEETVISAEEFSRRAFEEQENYVLRLYIMGMTPKCRRAISNMERICETELDRKYSLEIIDLKERPTLAKDEQIVAVPTLIKQLPEPFRRIVGDLSDTDRVLLGLDLKRG